MERPSMRRFIECDDNGEPELREEEIVDLKMNGVELTFEIEVPPEVGTLYVTTRRIIWMSETLGFDFDVPFIILHAITHDTESFPKPCLYCQLDEDEDGPSEMFLVPPQEADLQTLFDAFSRAAMLNPDLMEEEEDDQGFIYNVEEVQLGAEQAARLAHFESVFRAPGEENFGEFGASLENDDGQFEDAEEEVEVDEDPGNDEDENNDS